MVTEFGPAIYRIVDISLYTHICINNIVVLHYLVLKFSPKCHWIKMEL